MGENDGRLVVVGLSSGGGELWELEGLRVNMRCIDAGKMNWKGLVTESGLMYEVVSEVGEKGSIMGWSAAWNG